MKWSGLLAPPSYSSHIKTNYKIKEELNKVQAESKKCVLTLHGDIGDSMSHERDLPGKISNYQKTGFQQSAPLSKNTCII